MNVRSVFIERGLIVVSYGDLSYYVCALLREVVESLKVLIYESILLVMDFFSLFSVRVCGVLIHEHNSDIPGLCFSPIIVNEPSSCGEW